MTKLQLVEDWQSVLACAWSVKFNIAAALFGGAEVAVALVHPDGIPNGVFAGIAALISILANVARLLAQKETGDAKP